MEPNEHEQKEHHPHKVRVEVDGHPREVDAGLYTVAAFKQLTRVDPSKELDQLIHGVLTPLDDGATITIDGGEVFFSHVRRGGSSCD
jgi:hypothetical protein